MLPYPTDRRRLLMMVRVFLHEFSEFVGAYAEGTPHPSDLDDDCADHQLEAFLNRLAVDAAQIDNGYREVADRVESEDEILRSLAGYFRDLPRRAPWSHNRISAH